MWYAPERALAVLAKDQMKKLHWQTRREGLAENLKE